MRHSKLFRPVSYLAFSLAIVACGGAKEHEQKEEEKVKVNVETVYAREIDLLGNFTATVEANVTNNISPKTSTRIDKVLVEVGDNVRKGQIIATMDAVNLVQAELQMKNDSIEFGRANELYQIGGTSKSDWDAKKLKYSISKTNYDNLLENTLLISPIDGVVTARNYDSGDMYTMGQPLYTVEQIKPVKLKVNVSEGLYTQVKKGMPVEVKLDVYPNELFTGKVNLIYPSIDPATRTFPIEILIDNADTKVRPGMFARATIAYGKANHVIVPDISIVKQTGSGDRYVYTVDNGIVDFKKVELGRRLESEFEIISGLNSGDVVITGGQNRISNGMEVEVIQ